jgi:hypothetical protein
MRSPLPFAACLLLAASANATYFTEDFELLATGRTAGPLVIDHTTWSSLSDFSLGLWLELTVEGTMSPRLRRREALADDLTVCGRWWWAKRR